MSPTMWACHLDHIEHFKLLTKLDDVNKSFDLDNLEQDNDGRTWVHWCVRKNEPFQCLNVIETKICVHSFRIKKKNLIFVFFLKVFVK